MAAQRSQQNKQAPSHRRDATFAIALLTPQHRRALSLTWGAFLAVLAGLALSACGGSSDATNLLKQTFSGSHKVNSGNLSFVLSLTPSGSRTLKGPIALSFGGPFQSLGSGKIPQSNFQVSLTALGKTGSLGIVSTGTTGYVTLQGTSYQMPAATFQRLESSFSQLASSGATSGSGVLGKLGIQPLHWLVNPEIVGSEDIGDAATTHIRSGINVSALLGDFSTFLERASSLGISGASSFPHGLSSKTKTKIAGEVKNPRFDVWTGKSDKTIRKLQVKLTLPVSGQISTLLGGLRSADIGLTLQYTNLNQPQTITAPTAVRPYSEFATKVRSFLAAFQNSLGSAVTPGGSSSGGGTPTPGATTTPGTSGSGPNYQAYTRCVQAARNDISKLQACAPLLNGK